MAAFFHRHRVRYFETDHAGVVYHSRYLEWFEVARTEYLRERGIAYSGLEKAGTFLTVVEASCRYIAPASYDELLAIETWVEEIRPVRVAFAYRVRREGDEAVLAEGRTVLATVDRDRRPVRLPDDARERLGAYFVPPCSRIM